MLLYLKTARGMDKQYVEIIKIIPSQKSLINKDINPAIKRRKKGINFFFNEIPFKENVGMFVIIKIEAVNIVKTQING